MKNKRKHTDLLLSYKQKLLKTKKEYIEIKASRSKSILPLWASKFGGTPYLPKDVDYPKTKDGEHLYMIVQINLNEVPKNKFLPKSGILEFFITDADSKGSWGLSFDKKGMINHKDRDYFRVLYFEDVIKDESELITKFNFLPSNPRLPFSGVFNLTYSLNETCISEADYRFKKIVPYELIEKLGFNSGLMEKVLELKLLDDGHRLGGYPYFTQEDPRGYEKKLEDYELLFQMGSQTSITGKDDIMWGDLGVANFFIKPSDLKNLKFDNILYNWDCS